MTRLSDEEIDGVVVIALKAFAEALRDQAAVTAEQADDEVADMLREVADRIESKD